MNLVEFFTKKETKVVDQSNIKLPPVMLPVVPKHKSAKPPQHSSVFCKDLQERVIELIENAEYTVILSTFLLADERVESAVLEAAKRKVRVYVLLACETRLEGDEPDDEFGKMCLVQHKKMLIKLSGLVHFASAPHFHAKAVIADALNGTGHATGLLLTANLTAEALVRNEELAVSLTKEQIAELTRVFRWAIFDNAEHHMTSRGEFDSYKSPEKIIYPAGLTEILVTSSEEATIREHALKLIKQADNELMISSFGWQQEHQLVRAICERAEAGVKVTIFSRQRPAAMPALLAMKQAGVMVKCFKWLHAKAVIADGKNAMVMSANFQPHGMDEGFELGVKLSGDQVTELQHCLEEFLTSKHNELRTDMSLGMISGDFEVWENNAFKTYSVSDIDFVDMPPIKIECLSEMDKQPNIPNANWREYTAHRIEFRWSVTPPVIASSTPEYFRPVSDKDEKAKKQNDVLSRKSYEPKVVGVNKERLAITVCKESDFELAKKLKQIELPKARIVLEA